MAENKKEAQKKMEGIGHKIISDVKKGENPQLVVPIRALSNVYYDEKSKLVSLGDKVSNRFFFNVAHIRKFTQTVEVANQAKKLLESGKHLSLREVFYAIKRTIPNTNINIVDEQQESDSAIEDVELMTGLAREQMHINANRTGSVVGKVIIKDRDDLIDWSKLGSGGWSIPSNVEDIQFKKIDAKFIIYIEKAATFERLNEDKVWDKLDCVIVASQGQATRGIRRLLQRLHDEEKLPIYVLTDLDPWGFYIYSVLKFGSINLAAFAESLAIPDARFLGMTVEDIEKYGLEKQKIKFKDVDFKRLKQMREYSWFKEHKDWQQQFKAMDKMGAKVELAALTSRGITFISDTYLPNKIKHKEYLN